MVTFLIFPGLLIEISCEKNEFGCHISNQDSLVNEFAEPFKAVTLTYTDLGQNLPQINNGIFSLSISLTTFHS
jgi:hypothetical protein